MLLGKVADTEVAGAFEDTAKDFEHLAALLAILWRLSLTPLWRHEYQYRTDPAAVVLSPAIPRTVAPRHHREEPSVSGMRTGRQARSSYQKQIEKAIARGDEVSINPCVAAYLASYFDIIFAVNRLPHPGEKHLLSLAVEACPVRPSAMEEHVRALLHAAGNPNGATTLAVVDRLTDHIDELLAGDAV